MASVALTPSQVELVNSLGQEDIPIKLRCAICSKLAVNAFRLPCCDQAICETCQSALPSSCPVCEHSPVTADDCKPHKSLRTTIRVFLRTEEKKRDTQRSKQLQGNTPIALAEDSIPEDTLASKDVAVVNRDESLAPPAQPAIAEAAEDVPSAESNTVDATVPQEGQEDVPQPSIEEIAPGQESTAVDGTDVENDEQVASVNANEFQTGTLNEEKSMNMTTGMPGMPGMMQTPGFGMGFPGMSDMGMMGQGVDFNQMQMMMAMQNGMAPNAFGGFAMGMPGMFMDPMAMQNMFMNGGFGAQGMGMSGMNGMNGMNMGMGMAGFDGGMGSGFDNGWNGQQQTWNVGQDNFNHPNATGMGQGDFGANNSGFHRHNAAGFNNSQGNYNQPKPFGDQQQNGYGQHGRGRGRGRGHGFGRGGYNHSEPFSQQYSQTGMMTENVSIPTGPKADSLSVPAADVDEFGREIRRNVETEDGGDAEGAKGEDVADKDGVPIDADAAGVKVGGSSGEAQADDVTLGENDRAQQHSQMPNSHGDGSHAQSARSDVAGAPDGSKLNGSYNGTSMAPPQAIQSVMSPVVPINAPTGPKAMRQGLPNTSLVNLRGRGGFGNIGSRGASMAVSGSSIEPSATPAQNGDQSRDETSKDIEQEGSRGRDRTRTRSVSGEDDDEAHGRRRERHRESRRHRHRTSSRSEDEEEPEQRRERSRRRSRKHDEGVEDEARGEEDVRGEDSARTRSHSPTDSRRSGHRSRRERERESKHRERERDSGREHKSSSSSHKARSSHRTHRSRSRSRHRSHRDKGRERSREKRHRRRREEDERSRSRSRSRSKTRSKTRSRSRDRDGSHRNGERKTEGKTADAGGQSRDVMTVQTAFTPKPIPTGPSKPDITLNIPKGPRAMTGASSKPMPSPGMGIGIKGASARRQSIADDLGAPSGPARDRDRETERGGGSSHSHAHSTRKRDSISARKGEAATSATATATATSKSHGSSAPAKKTGADAHTLEREARNRERLLKEAQRMASLTGGGGGAGGAGGAGRKRSREEAGDRNGEREKEKEKRDRERERERKRGRRGEALDGNGGTLEERIARGESEREEVRWG